MYIQTYIYFLLRSKTQSKGKNVLEQFNKT